MKTKKTSVRRCPECGREVDFNTNRYRPFCSKRCQMADLGSWLQGKYRIPLSPYYLDGDMEAEEKS